MTARTMTPQTLTARLVGVLLAIALALVGFGRAHATPLPVEIDRGDVLVRAEAGLEAEAAAVAVQAEATLPRIALDLPGLPQPPRVEIRVVRDASLLPSVAPSGRGAPPWAAGVAYPDLGVLAVALYRGAQPLDPVKTLDHELAHLMLGAAVPRAPRWLHEGFAEQHAPEMDVRRLEILAGMAWFGNVPRLDELEATFPAEELPASRAYAQSYDFVGFLVERGRYADRDDDGDRWPFRYFLRALSEGQSVDAAARTAFGVDADQLYVEWRARLVDRYLLVPTSLFATALWVLVAILLVLAWRRRRRLARARLAEWADEETVRMRTRTQAPPHVVWPGAADPLAADANPSLDDIRAAYPDAVVSDGDSEDDDDAPDPPPRRWIN